jgi:hypothetical protein
MGPRLIAILLSSSLLLGGLSGATAFADKPARYFVRVRNVIEAPGVTSHFVDEAKVLFTEELKKHDAFTLDWPSDLPTDPEAMVKELRKRKLKAFEVSLKIMEVKQALEPPPPGKQYRVLQRGIKLSVFGDTLPDKVLAIGGDGESTIAAEVSKSADLDKEGKSLLGEATKVAVAQAVEMTLSKLDLNDKPQKLKSKKK